MNSSDKNRRDLQILVSASLALLLALIPLIGYLFNLPDLVTLLISKQPMVLSTAVTITVASISLAAYSHFQTLLAKRGFILTGILLITVALVVILETLFGLRWLDFPALHGQVATQYPGRMSVNTAICTLLIGVCFIGSGKPENKLLTFINGLSIGLVLMIAIFGLIGYFANFEFLVSFRQTNKMAIPTAIAYIALALGTFLITRRPNSSNVNIDLGKIYFTLEYLLVFIVLIVALVSFASSQQRAESLMSAELEETGIQSRMYFKDVIDLKIQDALIKAKRHEVIEAIIHSQANDDFNALMQELKKYGYLQVNLLKADGKTLLSVGHAAPSLQSVKISQKDYVFLEWANGYRLKIKTSVIDRGMKIGYIESIIELNQLSEFQKTVINKPGTADMVICGLENKYQKCFPFRWNEKPDSYYGFINGVALPVTRGALGNIDTSIMTDFRNERVMASIGPIGNTGLGMALKVDMNELYEPIKKQFYASFPLLIMFILGSIGLLRFKLKPLLEELEKSRLQMKQLAFHDTLTLLANKGLFHDHLLQAIARLSRNHKQLALLYLDIDFFKRVNDTYGHIVGDKLLIWFADVLRSCVRESDTVARIGGDEFAIILENPRSQQKVEQIAAKIIAKAQQELDIFPDGEIKSITTSIGIAITGKSDVSPEKLMQYADAALYKSKHNGRNTYSISNLDEIN